MTTPGCLDARVGERARERSEYGRAPLAPEIAAHLAACGACRAWIERARRMSAAWRDADPDTFEVAAAKHRYLARRAAKRRARVLPGAAAFAVVCVAMVAFAGARVVTMRARDPAVTLATGGTKIALPVRPPRAGAPRAPGARDADAGDARDADAEDARLAEAPEARLAARPQAPPAPPAPAPPAPSPALASAPPAPPPAPPAPAPPLDAPDQPAAPPRAARAQEDATWLAAADAMRAGDYPRAMRAFEELARSGDPRVRDEARLARAQLLVAQGRAADARADLEALAASGATPLVRARAKEALSRARARE